MSNVKAQKKAQSLQEKTKFVRNTFSLPETELVVQDYSCTYKKTLKHRGRMYITLNHVCFYSGFPKITEHFPFSTIQSISKEQGITSHIILVCGSNGHKVVFGGFMLKHRKEAFRIITYLHKFPPSYTILDSSRGMGDLSNVHEARQSLKEESTSSSNGDASDFMNSSASSFSSSRRRDWGDGSSSSSGGSGSGARSRGGGGGGGGGGGAFAEALQSSSTSTKSEGTLGQDLVSLVDTSAAQKAERLAYEIQGMAEETLGELAIQAETLDRTEQTLENINYGLDRADRLIRGMKNTGYAFATAATTGKFAESGKTVDEHTFVLKRKEQYLDVHILEKHSDDSLSPAMLRFGETGLSLLTTGGHVKNSWDYIEVVAIAIRPRPLHLDIRFKEKSRFRCMTSFAQLVTNQIYLLSKEATGVRLEVIFEPFSKKFQYGSPKLVFSSGASVKVGSQEKESAAGAATQQGGGFTRSAVSASEAGFVRSGPGQKHMKTSDLLGKNISQDVRDALDQNDKSLQMISQAMSDIQVVAETQAVEIDRSMEQLRRIDDLADNANHRMGHANSEMRKIRGKK